MIDDLKAKLQLNDEQIEAVRLKFSDEIITKALKATVFPSRQLFKLNLLHFSKHPD